MKKLLTSILAATMVAGMSVSAFAYVDTDVTPASDDSYTLSKDVYIDGDNGVEKFTKDQISSGDKLYYPILVNGEEIDQNEGNYYYSNRYSEIDDLRVKLDDTYGGKYIDGDAKIVRKDLGITRTLAGSQAQPGTAEVFTVTNTATINKAAGPITGSKAGEVTLTLGGGTVTAAIADLTAKDLTATDVATLFRGKTIAIRGVNFTITNVGNILTFTAQTKTADKVTIADKAAIALTKNVTSGSSSTTGTIASITNNTNIATIDGTTGAEDVALKAATKATVTLDFSAMTIPVATTELSVGDKTVTVVDGDTGATLYTKIDAGLTVGTEITIDGNVYVVKEAINTGNGLLKLEAKTAGDLTPNTTNISDAVIAGTVKATATKTDGVAEVPAVTGAEETFTATNTATVTKAAGSLTGSKAGEVTLSIGGGTATATIADLTAKDLTATDVATLFNGKEIKIDNVIFDITNTGAQLTFTAQTKADDKVSTSNKINITLSKNVTADNSVSTGTIATIATNTDMATTAGTLGEAPVAAGTENVGKIYCVEVSIGDYFGDEEKEVEFDLELRTRTRQYDSSESNPNDPNMAFTLGQDSENCLDDKDKGVDFNKNGELELEINKDTKSVKLDEAIASNGEKYDIENIFLEGDGVDFSFDVKASNQDNLFLGINDDANKKVTIDNEKADLYFVNFPGKPEFDFTGTAMFPVNDPDEDWYLYEVKNNKLYLTNAKYNKDDEAFVLRTRTLGDYVISDKKLKTSYVEDKETVKDTTNDKGTSNTGNSTTNNSTSNGTKDVPTGALA